MPNTHIRLAPVSNSFFNLQATLPYGLLLEDVKATIKGVHQLVYNLNKTIYRQISQRLEDLLMPATFSGEISEVVVRQLSEHSTTLTRNLYHNGHPDLIPVGRYTGDSLQYGHEGVEIKASRYAGGWQGHNPEKIWIMVFVFTMILISLTRMLCRLNSDNLFKLLKCWQVS